MLTEVLFVGDVESVALPPEAAGRFALVPSPAEALLRLGGGESAVVAVARSVAIASSARERAAPDERDDAFAAGLLCDLGLVLLATRAPELYGCDETALGFTHGEAGAYLLGLWGLPSTVVEPWPSTTLCCPTPAKPVSPLPRLSARQRPASPDQM